MPFPQWKRVRRLGLRRGAVVLSATSLALLSPVTVFAKTNRPNWNPGPPWAPLAPGSGEMLEISNLFWIMLVISGIVFAIVSGVLITSAVRYSARRGQEGEPRQVFGNRTVEVAWTVVPTVILLVAFVATTKAIHDINTPSGGNILNINVIGHQWWWEFRYPDNAIAANELHVPTGRQVRLNLLSADVVHNFWVPELAGKEQMIPGQNNVWTFTAEKAGAYDGACSEFCGTQHGWMRLTVIADAPADFERWLAAQKQAPSSASNHGDALALYATNACGGCHTIQGVSDGKVAPDLTHIGIRTTIGSGVLANTPENMVKWMKDPQAYKPGSLMPNFHFSDEQARQMAAFLEDLK